MLRALARIRQDRNEYRYQALTRQSSEEFPSILHVGFWTLRMPKDGGSGQAVQVIFPWNHPQKGEAGMGLTDILPEETSEYTQYKGYCWERGAPSCKHKTSKKLRLFSQSQPF